MRHDAWPSLPPGGHRPPDAPPFTSPGDQLLAVGLGAATAAGALVWASGQAAGLAFGHTWLEVSPADVAHVLWHLPQHWSDPALAWPADVRGPLPGPAGIYAAFAGVVGGLSGGTAAVMSHLPGRAAGHRPGHPRLAKHGGAVWASGRELRLLTVGEPEPGRVILGRTPGAFGRLLAAEDCHSVLVFGPTGSYKTSALVIPAVLEWSGPLVATSVKPDLLRATLAHRTRRGQVVVIDPLGASGVQAARWTPLASCATWAGAQQTALMLANAIEQTPTEEQRPDHRFWKTMGTKFLAPVLFAAATKGLGMPDVLHWLDNREDPEITRLLEATRVQPAIDAWASSQTRTDRAVDSLYATAEEVLHVYGDQRVAASTDGHDLDLDSFLAGDNTIYLYAPAHQQRLLRPLFETITQQVVAAAQEKAALAPDGRLSPRLGLFLDEAGNCAALSDLDVLATTARGQGIQLVTVWHDKSQLEARYGPKASTILNNHRAKLFLSGLADLSALELGAKLIGDRALTERNRSMGSDGRHSLNESTSYRPLLPIEDLRRLRAGGGGAAVRAPATHPGPAAALLRAARAGPPPTHRGPRAAAASPLRAAGRPQDRTSVHPCAAPTAAPAGPSRGRANRLAGAGRGPVMTTDSYSAGTPADQPEERPGDSRPAWERVAYTWLAREVDTGQPVNPAELAAEVSVAPAFAADLVRVLRAHRQRDPDLSELRARLVGDRITAAYLTRELPGDQQLDPATLAREVGTTTTVTRQWLHTLRAGQQGDPRLASLRAEPVSHGRPTTEQLHTLQAAYADGGRPQTDQPTPAGRPLERIEQLYRDREVAGGRPLDPAEVARQVGVSEHYVRGTLTALRGGKLTSAERIEQLWRLWEVQGGQRLAFADVARLVGVREGRVRQVLGPLRTARRHATEAERAPQPVAVIEDGGRQAWLDQAACRDTDPERFFPEPGEQAKAAEAKQVCGSCQVRDQCRDLAVNAAGAIDTDHGIFGGTLPTERSRLRGNTFPEPSAYRQRRDLAEAAHQLANQVGLRQAAKQLGIHRDVLKAAWTQWGLAMPERRAGWQPSRFLTDRAEAERAFALAEQLGSVNAAATQLETTWPSLRKAFTRHGLGMPARNPQAVRQRAIAAARRRSLQPAPPATPPLDPVFVALNLGQLPAPRGPQPEQGLRLRRAEEIETLSYRTVVALNGESRLAPQWRVATITRRAERAQRLTGDRTGRAERRQAERAARTGRSSRAHHQPEERGMLTDAR